MTVTIEKYSNAAKVFSPVRFLGQNYLKKRKFFIVKENGRKIFKYSGRAAVVVVKQTPMLFEYNMKQGKLTITFFVQRYDREDFVMDSRLQALTNESIL